MSEVEAHPATPIDDLGAALEGAGRTLADRLLTTFAEGRSKAADILQGVGDKLESLFEDAQRAAVLQLGDGSGEIIFEGQSNTGAGDTRGQSSGPGTNPITAPHLGALVVAVVAGFAIARVIRR